jgi:2-dehydro-3-deoxyphosphogluconate aldolase / (4S)-4-hydroxy-2-oxoglutarate aldolase
MARFSRIDVALKMKETGMVPVFYHPDLEICKQVLSACYKGGVRVFEFTNRGDYAHEVFGALNKYAAENMPDLMLGAGTIVDAGTASLYIQLGAAFIVSPVVKEDMAITCNRRKVLWAPGCGTLTEISRAEELGAEIVKAFPGFVLGPEFVAAAKGPFPWTSIMPTGGVEPTRESLTAWFKAGVWCVGMGSQLFPKEVIARKDFSFIENKVAEAMAIIKELK